MSACWANRRHSSNYRPMMHHLATFMNVTSLPTTLQRIQLHYVSFTMLLLRKLRYLSCNYTVYFDL